MVMVLPSSSGLTQATNVEFSKCKYLIENYHNVTLSNMGGSSQNLEKHKDKKVLMIVTKKRQTYLSKVVALSLS